MDTTQLNPARTSWPIRLYLAALVFAFATLVLFTPTLNGAAINAARAAAQAGICLILGLRLLWAAHRKEQGRTWVLYVACMLLAAPIWLLVERMIDALRN